MDQEAIDFYTKFGFILLPDSGFHIYTVNPGNSGGPVINKNGEIIGIISSKETNADGVVFAIKSASIYDALKDVKDSETIRLPMVNSLKGHERVQQIQKLEDYVYMVKGN